jgi:hypothetical protein
MSDYGEEDARAAVALSREFIDLAQERTPLPAVAIVALVEALAQLVVACAPNQGGIKSGRERVLRQLNECLDQFERVVSGQAS